MSLFSLFTHLSHYFHPQKIPEPPASSSHLPLERPSLSVLFHLPEEKLPLAVHESAAAMKYLHLLGQLIGITYPIVPISVFSLVAPPSPMPHFWLLLWSK
jgi:hypothetical protein